jgi:uncharacterized protein (TIGR02246 family)
VTEVERMVHAMCAAADANDADSFASYFSDDAYFRFGNAEPLSGKAAIAEATAATVSATYPVRHRVDQVVEVGSQVFCRFTILATKPDGEVLDLPCVTVIGLADGKIVDYRVHMDISPAVVV